MSNKLTPERLTVISNAVYAGNKIEAIKLYRTATGNDLKDSKDAVEKLALKLETKNPAMFVKQRRQVGSLTTPVFWGAIAALIGYLALRWID